MIDGKEGGTGAAPMEFIDHIGKPMRQGLYFVHNALIGIGVRDRIKLGAAGKIITAFDIVRAMALGADWCNAAPARRNRRRLARRAPSRSRATLWGPAIRRHGRAWRPATA